MLSDGTGGQSINWEYQEMPPSAKKIVARSNFWQKKLAVSNFQWLTMVCQKTQKLRCLIINDKPQWVRSKEIACSNSSWLTTVSQKELEHATFHSSCGISSFDSPPFVINNRRLQLLTNHGKSLEIGGVNFFCPNIWPGDNFFAWGRPLVVIENYYQRRQLHLD